MQHILFVGLLHANLDKAKSQLDDQPDLDVCTSTNLDEVRSALAHAAEQGYQIEHAFLGAGVALEKRLEIVREIFESSEVTNVHMKNANSGKEGFVPFVRGVLAGLKNEEISGMEARM